MRYRGQNGILSTFKRFDLREDKDLSIRELAEKLHIQRTTYHNYETGKRELPFDLAIKIAEFYNVSLDYIAGFTDTISPIRY